MHLQVDGAILRCAGLQPHGLLASLQQALGQQPAALKPPSDLQSAIEQLRALNLSQQELSDPQQLLTKLTEAAQSNPEASEVQIGRAHV